jgi:hypothetical protein
MTLFISCLSPFSNKNDKKNHSPSILCSYESGFFTRFYFIESKKVLKKRIFLLLKTKNLTDWTSKKPNTAQINKFKN